MILLSRPARVAMNAADLRIIGSVGLRTFSAISTRRSCPPLTSLNCLAQAQITFLEGGKIFANSNAGHPRFVCWVYPYGELA
jgi:hypothetical protein